MNTSFKFLNRDEELKKLLLNYGKYIIVSVYQADTTQKNRENTKRARFLESLIIENHYTYCKIAQKKSKFEIQYYFVIYGNELPTKYDSDWPLKPEPADFSLEKIRKILEENRQHFRVMNFYDNLPEILKGAQFEHPVIRSEKNAFRSRNKLFAENLYEPEECVGKWSFKQSHSEGRYMYYYRQQLASVHWSDRENCFMVVVGGCIPVGYVRYKAKAETIEEAFEILRNVE